MIQTVIFDMDGVIVDTEPVHHYAYHEHFKELNIDVTPEMYASYTGNSTRNIFQKLKEHIDLQEDVENLILRKRHLFNEAFDTKEDLFLIEGVEDLSLSTNATQLEHYAHDLKRAGLDRINVSLDSLTRKGVAKITGFDANDNVLPGLAAAND